MTQNPVKKTNPNQGAKNNQTADPFGDEKPQAPVEDFATMFAASLGEARVEFNKGDKVEGEVIALGKNEVFVSIQGQDGLIPRAELLDAEGQLTVKVGDKVTLFVIKKRDALWHLTKKASSKALSESLEDAFDFETPVSGKVMEVCNGGYRVEIFHKIAFCPTSQMDRRPTTNPEIHIGQKYDFQIVELKDGGRKFVVSRRKVLDAEQAEQEGELLERLKIGELVTGTVTRLEPFGAFVEIAPGVEGLVHISELGWSRVAHPSEVIQPKETRTFKVLKLDEDERGRLKISLSLKQSGEDPWAEAARVLQPGTAVEGKLKEKAHFGWLIEIRPGVVGLLPKSGMAQAQDEKEIGQKRPGETLRVVIQSFQLEAHRVSLSLPHSQDEGDWQATAPQSSGKSMGTLGDQFANLFAKK